MTPPVIKERKKDSRTDLQHRIGRKEKRKIKARAEKNRDVWFGLGMFGLVGWSVAIPTLIGIAVGVWIDKTWQSPYSWTLMGLFIGIVAGCLNAWFWIKRENRSE